MIQTTLSDISQCLTDSVIDKAFKQKTSSQDSVKIIEVTRAAPAGEGLLSAVYRIHVTGHQHSATFIVKGLVNNLILRDTLQCTKYFAREGIFFTDILPALIEVQKSSGAKECIQDYTPKHYSTCLDGKNDYILIEDLSERDCVSVSEYPTESERNKVLKALAHLHAVSIALRIKKPEVFQEIVKKIPELYYSEGNRDWYSPYQMNAVDLDREVLREYFEPSSIYYKKFDEIVTNDLYGTVIATLASSVENPVLCHGDAWCPNFLCSKDKAVAIDFQLFRCASLATDLTYLIMMCSNLCKEKQDFLDAVQIYYNDLVYFLRDMGLEASEVYTRATLDEEIKKYGRFGFMACLTSIPLMAGERFDVVTSVVEKVPGKERLPLENLWKLAPIKDEHKIRVNNRYN
ncbi:Uncharacterized protein OBRU01_10119 [Operophtera brumata]|uniref:CHK kinase-like domain-containing protein n=1 Tax=Operophtera brumata TaxID=104452 RepID=A0A0L7LF36_OPEBR|nr:Uncharacterized protein OBRU01_10119 [Operophtera brumata]